MKAIWSYSYRRIRYSESAVVLMVMGAFAGPILAQCELQTLWSPNGGADHVFGTSVAGSASMDVLVIGEDGFDNLTGAAYVYRWDDDTWKLERMLLAPDGPRPFSKFGNTVAMSSDGKTILIGEEFDDSDGLSGAGAVWVFIEKGGQWLAQAKLTASDAQDGWVFGQLVAISSDGNVAVASASGAPFDPVYVFTRDSDRWTEVGTLPQPDPSASSPAMAVSADGGVIVVGDGSDSDLGPTAGAANIFVRDAKTSQWVFRQKIYASDADTHDNFGSAVDLSAGGGTILVGASGDDAVILNEGAVYVFERQGDLWFEQIKLIASDPVIGGRYGNGVAITADGQRALIGTRTAQTGYIVERQDDTWIETMRFRPSDPNVGGFGKTVDIAADGSIGLLGALNSRVDGVLWFGAAVLVDLNGTLGDLDCDGTIGVADLLTLLASWGPCDCEIIGGCPADLDLDCSVGVKDLLILLASWG